MTAAAASASDTRTSKKRKNDEPSDVPSSASSSRGAVQCAYCGFAAADLEQSLTHLREKHNASSDDTSNNNNNNSSESNKNRSMGTCYKLDLFVCSPFVFVLGVFVCRLLCKSEATYSQNTWLLLCPLVCLFAADQATRVGQLLVAHALQDLPSGASSTNSALLEEARVQYARIVAFFTSLEEKNAGAALESLRLLFQDNLSMMATLQDASRMALEQAHKQQEEQVQRPQEQRTLAAQQEAHKQQQNELKLEPVAMSDGDDTSESDTGRASIHEEEAAQALTGLRALTPRVNAAEQEKKLQSVNAAQLFASKLAMPPQVPSMPQPLSQVSNSSNSSSSNSANSSSRNAAYPSAAMGFQQSFARSPLSITAPQVPSLPGMGSPIFHQSPDMFAANKLNNTNNGGATPSGTLPSIFARPLLAPLGSPMHNQEPGNMFARQMLPTPSSRGRNNTNSMTGGSHMPPMADWKSVAPSEPSSSSASLTLGPLNPKTEPSPTSVTPVTTAGYYRTFSQGTGQTSPVKRKSITSKQLMATPHTGPLGLPPSTAYAIIERSHPVRKANPRRWTKEEDEALRQAVESHREKNWKAIAAEVPGRNHTQCLQRWTKVLAPGLVKGHWSPQEDDLLRRLVASEQKNWGEVAAKIPGRTSKQCRERWHNHLDPNIVRGAYTPEEDRIILEAQARLGNRWSVIAAMLPGRTEDAVKIRWKSHCRVWRARKYLRKSPSDQPGGEDHERDDDDDEDDDSSDTESLSGMETPLAMTPMTPGYGHAYAWPTAPSASPHSSISNNSSNSSSSSSNGSSGTSSSKAATKNMAESSKTSGTADESSSAAAAAVGSEKRSVRVQ